MKRRNPPNHQYRPAHRYRRRRKLLPNCELPPVSDTVRSGQHSIQHSPIAEGNYQAIASHVPNELSQVNDNIPLGPEPDRELAAIQHLVQDIGDALHNPQEEHPPDAVLLQDDHQLTPFMGPDPQTANYAELSPQDEPGAHDHDPSHEEEDENAEHEHDHERNGPDADVAEESSDDDDEAATRVIERAKILVPWGNMFALLYVCGSVRFTVHQYEVLRFAMTWCRPNAVLPSYRTVRRKQFPFLINNCFPASRLFKFTRRDSRVTRYEDEDDVDDPMQQREHIPHQQVRDIILDTEEDPIDVRIVSPTEWAKLDVMTSTLYQSLFTGLQADRRGYSKRGWSLCHSEIRLDKNQVLNPTTGFLF